MENNSNGGSKAVGMLGYSPEEYKVFNKNAWIVLLSFSILYCFLYCGRLNLSMTMPAMMEEEGWSELELGILASVFFWTYGLGHLFNGRLGEIFGVNRFIVVGVFLSAAANVLIGFQSSLVIITVLWGLNGYFQSMLWSPGIALLSRWWPGDKRGFATGFANAFSALGQAAAWIAVFIAFAIAPGMGWKAGFIFPVIMMVIIAVIYKFIVKARPSAIGLKEFVDSDKARNAQDEELAIILQERGKLYPYIHLFKKWRFDLWLLIIAGSSIARYGLLTWIPTYYDENFGVDVKAGIVGLVMLPLGMSLGTFIMPTLTDKYFSHNRLPMVILSALAAGATVFFFRLVEPGVGAAALLFIAGFFIYAINGIVWAYATDVGGRVFSGTAAGVLDCFAYLGASVQAIYFGGVLTSTHNWNLVFMTIVGTCVAIAILGVIAGWGLNKKSSDAA